MTHKGKVDRRSLLAALAALPVAACARGLPDVAPATTKPLRVATFNIWHDAGGRWPVRRELLTAALRAADPDVIALQEVLQDAAKGLPNQADTIATSLGYPTVHFVAPEPEGAPKRYGNAILTRLPVIEVARRKLEPLDDYRTAIRVRVQSTAGPVDIVATHLAWQPEAGAVRARQVADLLGWLPGDGVPTLLMGDFNAPLDDPGLADLSPRFASALPPGAATTTLNPAQGHAPRVIDHIFVEPGAFAVRDARIIGDQPVGEDYPSDHFGVVAQLERRA
ncbi:MAG: endonuclease/exonuclease/phosphatase family protein [Sphingopyxis sp.]|uniref:endonuclease/exonuclease/phosphatase family protein n=1 Tax=Sphingopyxis sp. TaxID=1908224 RepID=UPI002ABBC672|nr:endonuclease/exonuclease/phosphatase family protein [Sphingopyxis sp.]MDZ3832187.1 endonuclease/exonuclease/phosphatase family protein [Sphingopyxis sp.]